MRWLPPIVLAVLFALFAGRNNVWVPVDLWLYEPTRVQLPLLLLFAVLAGAILAAIPASASGWRAKRRLHKAERALGEARVERDRALARAAAAEAGTHPSRAEPPTLHP